ncbi:hypothetical protein GWI33_005783 [Rhynchophorus ferrugineus]|uniref:Uncharacterized protein n=1 Tax=Rhynchophorus ferrugineus TaxID=354439 RepID=A0A834IWB3_RHYFE|nr:hypothetical protein GWI33_005783 [Rhynchophorus ferrugineus]
MNHVTAIIKPTPIKECLRKPRKRPYAAATTTNNNVYMKPILSVEKIASVSFQFAEAGLRDHVNSYSAFESETIHKPFIFMIFR